IRGVLPPGWPEGARILTMACAIGLVFLARPLARRRHRAWQLAIVVGIASAVAHLVEGLHIAVAAISLVFLLASIHWRGRFDVPGDPASVRFGFGLAALAGGIAAVALAADLRGADLPNRAADSLTAVGIVAGFAALYFWLRPFGQAVAQSV